MVGETTVTVIGNLVHDPELRFTNSGTAVSTFTMSSTPRVHRGASWTDGDTLFMRCNVWRQLAEHFANSVSKGDR